ncbi:MAG: hypothetical protein V5A30_05955 [Haloarculaceae archaeon]
MRVQHPQADRDCPLPAAVTCPDGETRTPDSEGYVDAPEDVAAALADAWAAQYDVPPDGLLEHGDDAGDTCEVVKSDGEVCGRELPCRYHSED